MYMWHVDNEKAMRNTIKQHTVVFLRTVTSHPTQQHESNLLALQRGQDHCQV